MEKVAGIGGFFFRAREPEKLAHWYRDNLGVALVPSSDGESPWSPEGGPTAFAPFPEDTPDFGDLSKTWMLNFRVRDLHAFAAQLQAAGTSVEIDPETYPYGRFAKLQDPEGNPIQLWQP
jgi:glyoxylase I family protein